MMAGHLLPRNSRRFEHALEPVITTAVMPPVEIRKVFDPANTPTAFLPYLAHHLSVDVWPKDGSETLQREITAKSLILHKHKGSAYTLREYVRFAGGEVMKFTRPPQHAFASPGQGDGWLKHYPQIRVYFTAERGTKRQFFANRSFVNARTGPRAGIVVPTTAQERCGRRATLFDRGAETRLRVQMENLQNARMGALYQDIVDVISLPGGRHRATFAGRWFRYAVPVLDTALRLGRQGGEKTLSRKIISPGADLIRLDPTRIAEIHLGPRWMFCANGRGRFALPSIAERHLYDAYWLYQPGRHIPPTRGRFFANVTRLGQPAFHAEIKVRVRRKGLAKRFCAGSPANTRFAYPENHARLREVMLAIGEAKSLRDHIDININCTDLARVSPVHLTGSLTCGQQLETI